MTVYFTNFETGSKTIFVYISNFACQIKQKYKGNKFAWSQSTISMTKSKLHKTLQENNVMNYDVEMLREEGVEKGGGFFEFIMMFIILVKLYGLEDVIKQRKVRIVFSSDGVNMTRNNSFEAQIAGIRIIDEDAIDPETGKRISDVSNGYSFI